MIKYFIKYYIYNGSSKLLRSSFVLPLLTIVVGCFVMMTSFSIMEGFSNEISDTIYFFDKEHSLTINKKEFFDSYNAGHLDSLFYFLTKKKYFFNAYEDRVMFINNKIVSRVYGIINFDKFRPKQFLLDKDCNINIGDVSGCYLGYNHSLSLSIDANDSISISSILDFKNLNSFPERKFYIKGIIKTDISRYDDSIFIPFDSLLFSKNIFLNINLNDKINKADLAIINSTFGNGIIFNKGDHLFSELFYAINYEKFFYVFFGLFIIFISSIMLMGFNVTSIIKNISSIGLLESLGFKKHYIGLSYFLYGLFIAVAGFLVSFLLFKFLLILDKSYGLMHYIFDPNIYFAFNLELSGYIILRMFLLVLIIISLSTFYPLYKISKLDIIDSIKNRA